MEISWDAPADCPQAREVRGRVHEYLGPGTGLRHPVRAQVAIEKNDQGRYQLRLHLTSTTTAIPAERSLSADSCDAVAHAAALLIAIAVDPELAGQAGTSNTTAQSASSTVGQPPQAVSLENPGQTKTAEGATPATPSHSPGWGIALGALLDQGSLPGASLGLSAELEAEFMTWLRFGFGAQLFTPSEGSVSQIPTATINVSAFMATGRACARWLAAPIELGPCAFGEAGQLKGRAEGIRQPHSGSALWLALGASLRTRLILGERWKLSVDVGAVVPHSRRRFLVSTDNGTVSAHQVAPAALRIGLGILYEFE